MVRNIKLKHPIFTISLDFELMWGVFDKKSITTYGQNISSVHSVIPMVLELFNKYDIHCTWATVGMLFNSNLDELKKSIPDLLPSYVEDKFSAYNHISNINEGDFEIYYSGDKLINKICSYENQEIATHTYSHYYCLEEGQNADQFKADLELAILKGENRDIKIKSIIFPRNQYNLDSIEVCKLVGIRAFRGNETNFIHKPRNQSQLNTLIRALRYLDSYIKISGYNTYKELKLEANILNIPSSSFLRPYNSKLRFLEKFKLKRIKSAMLHAAKNNSLYHLWWHPHNFGANINENLFNLEEILKCYSYLNSKYKMKSLNMNEVSEIVL